MDVPVFHPESSGSRVSPITPVTVSGPPDSKLRHSAGSRQGKAPPVDPFTGENDEIRFDDWLPVLKRASTWNSWTEDDLMIQLAGHLRGRALQEWDLLTGEEKSTFESAVEALRKHLESAAEGKMLAAQDFRHASQRDNESVSDFLRWLERSFKVAYGRDGLSLETQHTLLHAQLHEALKFELMRAPAVSGAQTYQSLCLAAKNEEHRLSELRKRQQYKKPNAQQSP